MKEIDSKIMAGLKKSGRFKQELPLPQLTLLHGDASARRYVRISGTGYDPLVAMILAPEQARFSEEAMKGPSPDELPFVNIHRALDQQKVRVPIIHFVDEELGLLLLEDLGDDTMARIVEDADRETILQQYRKAVDLLLSLQKAMEREKVLDCLAFSRAFEFDLLRWELDHFLEYLVALDRKKTFSTSEQLVIDKAFDQLALTISNWPRVFVHRDFQSRNLMLKDEQLVLIDFQDALLGPAVYDLVALLRDSYIQLDREMVGLLIDHYLEGCQRLGLPGPDRQAFLEQFDRQTVQRKLKDAGRFVFIDRVKKNPNFLPFIPLSLAYVAEALSRLDDLKDCQEILAKAVPELAR